jgi:light-regulated signal transduction histidine kinase (bacteriophytochrome)
MAERLPDERDCAREAIHLSGAIQPHGYLVSCTYPGWEVRQASANIDALFDLPAADLLGRDLREFVARDVIDPISDLVDLLEPGDAPQRAAAANIGVSAQPCDVGVHVAGGLLHIEIEPREAGAPGLQPTVMAQAMVASAGNAGDMDDFLERCARQVRQLTGYDRVMVYRFRHDDAGEVVAESREDWMEPYLGLRFPASDIPVQARALYVRNRIRVIPDAGYRAVPIVPGVDASGAPLDLSQHALRSVSPVHLEYLRNMGVQASMSISIVVSGRLWGLIACHHRVPRPVPLPMRAALDLFGLFVSIRVGSDVLERAAAQEERTHGVREALSMRLGASDDVSEGLASALETAGQVVPCDGVGLWRNGAWIASGSVPDAEGLRNALAWAQGGGDGGLPATDDAADWGGNERVGVAGILAIPFGRRGDWLLFFRREQREDVRWAGDPHKPMVATDDGLRIAPRRSFSSWREIVRGKAAPWSDGDRRAARQLQRLLQERLWQPLPDDESNVTDMVAFRRRHVLQEQKSRLDQLASLLDGMGHLGDAETLRIGERIAALEAELLALMRAQPSESA